jgi:hypothetical protein
MFVAPSNFSGNYLVKSCLKPIDHVFHIFLVPRIGEHLAHSFLSCHLFEEKKQNTILSSFSFVILKILSSEPAGGKHQWNLMVLKKNL